MLDEQTQATVARLTAMADVRPDLKPVVDVALSVVKSARGEVAEALARAELAERTLRDVRPHVDALARRADESESELAAREELDREREARESRRRREERSEARLRDGASQVASALEDLAKSMDRSNALVGDVLAAAHTMVEPSLLTHPGQYGPFVVSSACGRYSAVVETRKDALGALAEALALKWGVPIEEEEEEEERVDAATVSPAPDAAVGDEGDVVPGAAGANPPKRRRRTSKSRRRRRARSTW